jgi:hypothetical protein
VKTELLRIQERVDRMINTLVDKKLDELIHLIKQADDCTARKGFAWIEHHFENELKSAQFIKTLKYPGTRKVHFIKVKEQFQMDLKKVIHQLEFAERHGLHRSENNSV